MREDYNGYELSTVWDDEALGFGFRIHDRNGKVVSYSIDACFYEENALTAARDVARTLPAQD